MGMRITIEISADTARALALLGEGELAPLDGSKDSSSQRERIEAALAKLADHAEQGVSRPGAWEREWASSVFGHEWQDQLEPDPSASWRELAPES